MRYLPLTAIDRAEMLGVVGVDSIEALFADVPEAARLDRPVDLPKAMGEIEVERLIARMAARNIAAGSVPATQTAPRANPGRLPADRATRRAADRGG